MKVDPRFTQGLKLFAEGEYFECHEVIEELWLDTSKKDPNRELYQGVIQAAAAIYQLERGILSGALGLYKTSLRYLKPYSPKALGCDVDQLIAELHKRFKK